MVPRIGSTGSMDSQASGFSPVKVSLHSGDEERDWWTPPLKLGEQKVFDLITDPKEEYPATGIRNTWVAGPAMKIVAEFDRSFKKHPPIAPRTTDPYVPPASEQQ